MVKTPRNQGGGWTPVQVQQLQNLADQNTPTRIIALKMARTPAAIYSKAAHEGISLKPTNQSPYNRRTK
ncbi:MAG: hypothetical protein C4525_07265 [Desulfarculus sp.]|jgi:hypothetical protein|nr:MAG: hypothetical protein C4525_07265 [Desulfarculus sp.]